jgi:DNA segregation ATPase FtsK/SpoIIIE, S-DNA-T family
MSLTRIINKTPLQNEKSNVHEVEINSNLINQILQSRFIGEGVYCLEQLSMPDYKEQYLITPSFDKMGNVIQKDWNFKSEDWKEMNVYELVLEKPMFMSLDSKQFVDLFTFDSQATVFMQVLICKRLDNWREIAISQYESFLNGNDEPLESKFAIKFQGKVLNVLNKISNYTVKREPIEEIEQKILQHNYRFECRFIVYEQKYVSNFESEMEKNLKKLQLFNEFRLKKVQNKRDFIKMIENRQFQVELVNQLLSEQEIYSLLCSDRPTTIQKIELEKPVKQQSVVRNLEESMLLQKAIQLMPIENRNVEIDQSKAEIVNQAFKRVGIVKKSLKVTEMYQGSSLLKVQMQMSSDITYTSISKKLLDIQAALGNQNVSIEIGNKPDTISVFLPLEERGVLYFRGILESEEFQQFKKKCPLPIILGESVNGEYLFADLTELRHMLVAGATGGGKSIFVNLLILSLLLNVPPDEIMLYLIDPKMVEFTQFKGFPQVKQVITDMKKANVLLDSLTVEMDNRYEIFSKAGVREIQGYNELDNGNRMKYIVCAIDEFADLMMVNKAVEDYVVRLGQKARGAGIHLIIATQRPSVDVITGLIKANMPCRIAFSTTSAVDSKTILDKGGAEKLLGRGDGLAKIEGSKHEFQRFQSPVLTLNSKEESNIYKKLKELFECVDIADGELPESESEIDKLKRIIANTSELRVSELGRLMEVGNNKVHALMVELLQDEWLRKEGRGYVVNVDEEEINKWRESS